MNLKIVVHEAEEGGPSAGPGQPTCGTDDRLCRAWAEALALPGCVSQGETMDELLANMREAVAAWLEAETPEPESRPAGQVVELSV